MARLFIEKLFEHARRTPGKRAISYNGRDIGYGEFARWISHARQYLNGRHIRPGSIAVLDLYCLVDCWVFGIALRNLGFTTIAMPPNEPLDLSGLDDVGCVVTNNVRGAPSVLEGAALELIRIPQHFYLNMKAESLPDCAPLVRPASGHILFTSGTTGSRKKILIDDARLTNLGSRFARVYDMDEYSTVNVFDFGTWTGVAFKVPSCAWMVGGAVVIHQGPDRYRSLFAGGITHAVLTPVLLAGILVSLPKDAGRNETLRIYVGGGPLPSDLASEARARLGSRLFAFIASTEAGHWTMTPIERDEDLRSHLIHPSAEVQVVDDSDRPLPPGQIGAIRIRTGDHASMYLGDDDASRAAFRHGFFYPGDLGTIQDDGRLVLRGRMNSVLNILGNKIPAEEIELALQERLSVDAVCVLSLKDEREEDEFHVVIEASRPVAEARLAPAIRAQLPGVPHARVRFVDALPRNDLGKIDRAAVRRMIQTKLGRPA